MLALVAVMLIDRAAATTSTRVRQVSTDRALEEALAALARQHAVVLPRTLVATDDALGAQLQPVCSRHAVVAVTRRVRDGSDVSMLLGMRVMVRLMQPRRRLRRMMMQLGRRGWRSSVDRRRQLASWWRQIVTLLLLLLLNVISVYCCGAASRAGWPHRRDAVTVRQTTQHWHRASPFQFSSRTNNPYSRSSYRQTFYPQPYNTADRYPSDFYFDLPCMHVQTVIIAEIFAVSVFRTKVVGKKSE